MRQLYAVLALFFVITPAVADDAAAGLRAVTHEDVWLMWRPGTPAVSPDGRWAVFSVTEPSYNKDDEVKDLWVVPVDGSRQARRLTATKSSESDLAWSPDSTKIAFSAKRDDNDDAVTQVYVLDMTGPGEAIQLTDWPTGARKPKWSPDGRRIAFEVRLYPGIPAEIEATREEKKRRDAQDNNVSSYENFPIRRWDKWRDNLHTQLAVQDGETGSKVSFPLAGSKLIEQTGYAGVPTRSGDTLAAEWAPDGSGLVFSATTNLHEAAFSKTFYHLYYAAADGSEVRPLTEGTQWVCHSAKFAPDGKSLVCQYDPVTEFVYENDELARLPWPVRGEPQVLTDAFDRSVGGWTFSSNGRSLYIIALDHARTRLFTVPARGGTVKALHPDSSGVYAGVEAAGRHLVARWESSAVPAEIVRVDARTGRHTPLTSFNTERAAKLDRQPYREFWFESSRGRRIHSWLALPPGFDENKKYPLVLFIHGGPHSSSRDADHVRWSPHLLAAPGYVVLLTDYTGSVGYGEQFARNIQGDPLRTPGDELIEAVDEAIKRFVFIDGERLAAAGASYGGHLANWLQGNTKRFKALINHAGLVDLEGQWSSSDVVYHRELTNGGPAWGDSPIWKEQSPATYADNWSTPMLLTIGEKDYRVPVNQTIAAWTYLKRKNVPGRLLVYHDANHWIMKGAEAKHYWEQVHEWLARHLNP
ncbi:MAG: S9 family peptidase [Gammaproteobacteria bacterium]|nr:S9 family peptidase [Gammaproteobacteria bacterium]